MTVFPPAILKSVQVFAFVAALVGFAYTSTGQSQPQALGAGLPGAEKLFNPDLTVSYYMNRALKPVWVRGPGKFQPRVDAVVKILEDSWTHGLNPEKYRIDEITQLAASPSSDTRLQLDMVITDAVIRYVHDLTGMRGQAQSEDKKIKYWREPVETADILTMISDAADPIAKIRALEPQYALYQSLREELMRLAALPSDKDFKPIQMKALAKPGRSYPQIPTIRAKMDTPPADTKPDVYDEALAVEIIKLQKAYGLETDGVIGPRTLELINQTNEDKIWQIVANMERLRWISQGRPDRYILVNIPSASLWAVDGGQVKLEMPVIVGKTARPTYSFKTEITGVRFNPNWTVPPTIKKNDFLPMLREDPYALTKRNIELVYNGRTIDPGAVDWHGISSRDLHSIRMVQKPGEENPLGKVRVIMENPYNIYLHDTNHREAFDKNERNLSSGCIRVSKPEELAAFILSHNDGWDAKKIQKTIDSGRMRDIPTEQKIPVFITYQTVWLNTDGRLVYGRDVYGQDKNLADMLKKANAIHLPQASEKTKISL